MSPRARRFLPTRAGRETIRAFLVFALLLTGLVGFTFNLSLRALDLEIMLQRLDDAMEEGQRIAEVVAALGRGPGGDIDFHRLRQRLPILERIVNERLDTRVFLRFVEARDRFGARLFFIPRETAPGSLLRLQTGDAWPLEVAPGDQILRVPIPRRGPGPAGEVRVGLSEEAFRQEVENLRRSIRNKMIAASVVGAIVLVGGLIYVLYLLRKNRRLERSRQAAERRSYVGLLASGLAHEIRNPLNAMNMNLQMLEEEMQLEDGYGASDHRELLESTKSEIKRLERLVNNFLAYARPSEPKFESRDLNTMLREIARFLEADFRKSGVEIDLRLEPLLPHVDLDETQFRQAVINLLVNARQVLRGGGRITARTRPGAGGDVVLEIADDGPGISAEAQERIFEVFYSSRGGGTGLGLPIARQIVERHGGNLEVESREGEGATFRIHLPRRHAGAAHQSATAGAGTGA